ncbi:hypothetical protein U27_01541 [Candidatus Vecturithrix granuli]|uniref:Uncharacterized protein n=1 Tax=Vecturithrix granuli TaxID=1499967 RepID=A0A081CAN5_VECG1|nr:hypothetical protein U27_01541 [Candidatus Vecturithrix granuli]
MMILAVSASFKPFQGLFRVSTPVYDRFGEGADSRFQTLPGIIPRFYDQMNI